MTHLRGDERLVALARQIAFGVDWDGLFDWEREFGDLLPARDVTALLEVVATFDEESRAVIVRLMAFAGHEEVRGMAEELARARRGEVRLEAAAALAALGDRRGVDVALDLLEETVAAIRRREPTDVELRWIVEAFAGLPEDMICPVRERHDEHRPRGGLPNCVPQLAGPGSKT